MSEKWNRSSILEMGRGFLLPRILLSAGQLDLFTKLGGAQSSVEDLCSKYGFDERGLTILLDALVAMELATKSADGKYGVEGAIYDLLARDGADSILPMIEHNNNMWRTWSNLTEIVTSGMNPKAVDREQRSDADTESFIGAMHVIGKALADEIAGSIDLDRYRKMLDVGGGSGIYTIAFLKKAPQLSSTIFDLPKVCEISRAFLDEAGMRERAQTMEGDFRVDEFPKGHDLVLLSAIIHMNSREGNRDLFRKAYECLEPGGTLMIRDYFLDESRTRPMEGAIFAVNMLVGTSGGNSYTVREVSSDLEAQGFKNVRIEYPGNKMDKVMAGDK